MTAIALNVIALSLLFFSFTRDKGNTMLAIKRALKKGISLLPIMLFLVFFIGLLLTFLPPGVIRNFLGNDSSLIQIIFMALIGAVMMIPSLVALPLAGSLIDAGASYTPVAAFITTLTMVGFVTIPLESKELGKKITLVRNLLALIFSLIISLLIGVML